MSSQHEKQIHTVLNALRQAEPDPALQDRIVAAMHTVRAPGDKPVKVSPWRQWPFLSSGAMPWLVAAALLLTAGGTLLLHTHAVPGSGPGHAAGATSSPPREVVAADEAGSHSAIASLNQASRLRKRGSSLRPAADRPVPEAGRGTRAEQADARSFPAPPLPLSEQERLLLRLAHHEAPQQLAQLTRATLDANYQQEQDSFAEFFVARPPLRGQQEPPSDVSPAGQQ